MGRYGQMWSNQMLPKVVLPTAQCVVWADFSQIKIASYLVYVLSFVTI